MAIEDFEDIMNLQRQMASRVVRENEMELQMKILEIIQGSVKDKNQLVSTAKIMTAAEMEGIDEDKTARILKTLEDLSYIKRMGGGYKSV